MKNIEDKFFGKRIVKGIFSKAKFAHKNLSALIAKAKQLGIQYAKEGYGSPSAGDSRWQKLHSELLAGGGGSQYSPENVQAEKEMLNAFMEANKKERSRLGFSRTGVKAKFEWTKEIGQKIQGLKKDVSVTQSILRDTEKSGNHNNCVGYCQSLSSLYSQLGKAFGDAARNTMSRTGGKTKFAKSTDIKELQKELDELDIKFNETTKDTRRRVQLIKMIKELRLQEKAGMSRTGAKKKFRLTERTTLLVHYLEKAISALRDNDIQRAGSNLNDARKNLSSITEKSNGTKDRFIFAIDFAAGMMKKDVQGAILYIKAIQDKLYLTPDLNPRFSRKSAKSTFGGKEALDYGDFTTKGGQTYIIGYTENWDGTYTAYLHSGMDRINRMKVCKTWEEFQSYAKELAKKHNAISQDIFARTGGKTKFSARVDTDSIKRWVNEYGGNINSDKNRGAWAFTEVNTGETIVAPISLLFKEAVSWLRKNGKQNSTYKVAL